MKYIHEQIDDEIKALTSEATDSHIATLLSRYYTEGRAAPFTFSINHNAKAAPCPIHIDKPGMKASFATLRDAKAAAAWLVEAFTRGYEVTGTSFRGQETRSIAGERRRQSYNKQMEVYRAAGRFANPDLDDDIPF
jgi:hypothetical protein